MLQEVGAPVGAVWGGVHCLLRYLPPLISLASVRTLTISVTLTASKPCLHLLDTCPSIARPARVVPDVYLLQAGAASASGTAPWRTQRGPGFRSPSSRGETFNALRRWVGGAMCAPCNLYIYACMSTCFTCRPGMPITCAAAAGVSLVKQFNSTWVSGLIPPVPRGSHLTPKMFHLSPD